ncbi:MAG: epoxide hydrolase [Gammaproteobacteria bacterium]|nr:epoxide hydrolase [Gammaproteobacteria bacterium]
METHTIRTEFVETSPIRFEVDMCGEGDRLALCLHGFPEHAVSWRHQMPLLARLGYRAWATNLRGYGNSTRPLRLQDYGIEVLMDDIARLIDAADAKEVILLAHDWGAVIAWFFAMRRIRPLDRLIICNVPHPGPMARALKGGFDQLLRSWYVLFFQLPWLPEFVLGRNRAEAIGRLLTDTLWNRQAISPEHVEVFRNSAAIPGALTAMVNYYRALVRGGGARRQQKLGYPVIDIPTLMLWGDADMALGVETIRGTNAYVSDLTLRVLPHISHWVQQDAPEEVNAMIEAFLKGRSVPQMRWIAELHVEGTVEGRDEYL